MRKGSDIVAHGVSDAAQLGTLLLGSGLVATGLTPHPLTELQVLLVSVGVGVLGGLTHALIDDVDLHWREYIKRMMASGLLAPGLVALAIIYLLPTPGLLHVVSAAGPAGLAAYPLAKQIPKLAPKALREWWGRVFGGAA